MCGGVDPGQVADVGSKPMICDLLFLALGFFAGGMLPIKTSSEKQIFQYICCWLKLVTSLLLLGNMFKNVTFLRSHFVTALIQDCQSEFGKEESAKVGNLPPYFWFSIPLYYFPVVSNN